MVRERRKGVCVAAVDKQLQVVADVEPPAAVSLRVLDGLELAAQLAPRHCTGLTELGATQLLAAPRVHALPRLFAPAALGLVVLELECVVVPAARALQRLRCGRFLPLRRHATGAGDLHATASRTRRGSSLRNRKRPLSGATNT